jgi:hypothetical protein
VNRRRPTSSAPQKTDVKRKSTYLVLTSHHAWAPRKLTRSRLRKVDIVICGEARQEEVLVCVIVGQNAVALGLVVLVFIPLCPLRL